MSKTAELVSSDNPTTWGLNFENRLANDWLTAFLKRFMPIITVHAAKTNLSKLIERAEAGEEIIIARGKNPAVKLIPVKPLSQRHFGLYKGLAKVGPEFFEPLPEEELQAWDGDARP